MNILRLHFRFGLLSLLVFSTALLPGCRAEEKKQMWARSVLNQKGPELVVEKWLSEKPDTAGKFVLVDFWATWCGPCRKGIPELNAVAEKFKNQLVVIGISDEPEETVRAMQQPRIAYFSAIDQQARMKKALEVKGIPHAILVDPQGIVRWEGFPLLEGHELTEEVIEGIIRGGK